MASENQQVCSRIHLRESYTNGAEECPSLEKINQFSMDGYSVFPNVLSQQCVDALNHQLELVLRGEYDTQTKPDKSPKLIKTPMSNDNLNENDGFKRTKDDEDLRRRVHSKKALGYSGNTRKKVFQVINIHKSDRLFHELVTTPFLGKLVAKLMNWEEGARLAQDQIWAKPPGAPPLAYHRDSPYFMFKPNDVCTVWIALDDLSSDLGPLQYVKSSHLWGEGRVGSSQNFFQDDGGKALLHSAAERAGIDIRNLEFESLAGMAAGGISIHDGRTWHGSGPNISDLPRRGIGLHFVPVNAKWTADAMKSRLWRKYVEEVVENDGDVGKIELDDEVFPITWTPKMI